MATHVDASDYHQLAVRCRTAPPDIRREFQRRVRDAAQIGARAARVKAQTVVTVGAGRHGVHQLRRRGRPAQGGTPGASLRTVLAANITVHALGGGVEIRQGSAGIRGRGAHGLPRGIDSGMWRHPTFGHAPEVRQIGTRYFKTAIEGKRDEMEREVAQVLDDIERRLS